MARVHGREGEISLAAATTPEGSPSDLDFTVIGSLSAWSLSFSRPTLETTHLRSSGKTYRVGLEDVTGGFDGVFDTDYISTLVSAEGDPDAVWIRITPNTDYPEIFFQGSAWLNLNLGGTVGDAVRASATLLGNGIWQKSFGA